MLRGLFIRQAFVLGDWLLVLLIVAGAGAAGLRAFGRGWVMPGGCSPRKRMQPKAATREWAFGEAESAARV